MLRKKKSAAATMVLFYCVFSLMTARQSFAQTVAIPALLYCTQSTTATSTCVTGFYASVWNSSGSSYWQYTLNTAGYSNISMSFSSSGSNTGPKDWLTYYNTTTGAPTGSDVSFGASPAFSVSSGSCVAVGAFTLPAPCNNIASLAVRLKPTGTAEISGSSSYGTGGTNRVPGSLTTAVTGVFTGQCSTPIVYTVSATSACAGSSVTLSGSDTWASYTLKNGATTGQTITGTGSALTFTATPTTGTYTVLATNIASGCATTAAMSGDASITDNVPTITTNPGDAIVCSGDATSFSAVASGATSYQWQKSTTAGGSTFANITGGMDGGIYGASYTTATLTITGPDVSENNFNYQVIAVNTCGNSLPSSAGNLTVNTCVGSTITTTSALYGPYCNAADNTVSVAFSSTGTYTGIFNAELSDASGSFAAPVIIGTGTSPITATIPAGTLAGTGYRIRVSNTAPATDGTDNGSDIIINGPTIGGTVSTDQTICPAQSVADIALSGNTGTVLYWQSSSSSSFTSPVTISSTAGLTTLPGTTIGALAATTYYQAVVQNGACASANSGFATITVNPSPTVTVTPDGGSYCSGSAGLSMTASGADTYTWAPATGLSAATGSTVVASSSTNVTYTVTGTSVAGCSTINTATVNYISTPSVPVIPASIAACAGSDTTNLLTAFTGAPSPASVSSGTVDNSAAGAGHGVASSAITLSGVPSGATVTGVSVTMDITSNYLNDYIVNLVAPNGDIINLANLEGPHGAGNYTGTIISSAGTTALNTGATPFTATYAADAATGVGPAGSTATVSSWSSLYNIPNGSWTLQVYNSSTYTNTATLLDWSVSVSYTLPSVIWSPVINLYTDAAGTLPYTGTATDTVYQLSAIPAATTYTVTAANAGCTSAAVTTVSVNPTPSAMLTGNAAICNGSSTALSVAGGTATALITINGGAASISLDGTGTGSVSVTPVITTTYTATVSLGGCSAVVSDSPVVTVNPLPTAYTVSGTGGYCSGGTGVDVTLSNSDAGISYQLYNGATAAGSPVAGTGVAIDFGMQTTAATYTAVATNTVTGCVSAMTGSATITIDPLPGEYNVTGGGNYCSGSTGMTVGVDNSDAGVSYQLYNGTTAVGTALAGTGAAISFGTYSAAGTYTVSAVNATTGCNSAMAGNAIISINPLPTAYSITGGGGYCSGGAGSAIGLSFSDAGISYQLYNGATVVGSPVAGTGAAISFGSETVAATYTVMATNTVTGCANAMTGSAVVSINPLPVVYTVEGGGSYCAGGTGVVIATSNADGGINYQLYNGADVVGPSVAGSGLGIDFGLYTVPGTYTVLATDATTGCTSAQGGSAIVTINPLATIYTVTGTGSYCLSGTGVDLQLTGSDAGINYQLYDGGTATGFTVPGSGSSLDLGMQALAGTYTVMAINATTGCTNPMAGSATVTINPLPTAYNVTGGGSYCIGGIGSDVALSNSDADFDYQLYSGSATIGGVEPGTGTTLDFGMQTAEGTYTILATNTATGCVAPMNGSATVIISPMVTPSVTITSSASVICGGIPVMFTPVPVNGGTLPAYSWYVNGSLISSSATYSYLPANGDMVYAVLTSNVACPAVDTAISDTFTIAVNPVLVPSVTITAPSDTACAGSPVTFAAIAVNGGTSPMYQWSVNGIAVATGPDYTYTPATGDVVTNMLVSNAVCATPDSVQSDTITMEVAPIDTPAVTIAAVPGLAITTGENDTLTAAVTNGGGTPSYQWLINGTPVAGATAATFVDTFANKDSITCQVTNTDRCGASASTSVIINVSASNVGVQQIAAQGLDIQLLPNPNNGSFTIKGNLGNTLTASVSLEVTDMLGQSVYKKTATAQSGNVNEQIQLGSNIATGMYFLNLRSGSENTTIHFVVK